MLQRIVRHELPGVPLRVYQFAEVPGSVCSIWRQLCRFAYQDGGDYFVLLGDDVVDWIERVIDGFDKVHRSQPLLPRGFGCIAIRDRTRLFAVVSAGARMVLLACALRAVVPGLAALLVHSAQTVVLLGAHSAAEDI